MPNPSTPTEEAALVARVLEYLASGTLVHGRDVPHIITDMGALADAVERLTRERDDLALTSRMEFSEGDVQRIVTQSRAALLASLRAKVEAEIVPHGPENCTMCAVDLVCYDSWRVAAHNAALARVLAAMDGEGV